MSWYALVDETGDLQSVGSVLADPLPAGLTAIPLDDEQSELARTGGVWNPATRTFTASPAPPAPAPTVEQLAAAIAQHTTILDEHAVAIAKAQATGPIFRYRAKAPAITGDPGPGFVRWNKVAQTTSTVLAVDVKDQDDLDVTIGLSAFVAGNSIYLQDHANAANFQEWSVTGPAVNQTGWWDVPVVLDSSGGTGTSGFPNGQMLAMRAIRSVSTPPRPTLLPATEQLEEP